MDLATLGVLTGVAGILVGIISSYVFYRRGTRVKQPACATRSTTLVRDFASEFEDVRVLFRDAPVVNLTVTKLMFWNEGRATIDRADIVPANPLRIAAREGVRILDAKVLATNRTSTAFTVQLAPDAKSALIEFEYLDQRNGAVIQILHDGTSSDDLQLHGDIKGAARIASKPITPRWATPLFRVIRFLKPAPRVAVNLNIAFALLYLAMAGYFWATPSSPDFIQSQQTQPALRVVAAGLSTVAGLLILSLSLALRRRWRLAPPGLEIFYD